jgi:CAAX prenyl protease-like protein
VAWLGLRAIGYVLVVPLAEELAFRGYLVRRLQAANFREVAPGHFTVLALVVSAALFGVLHGRYWLAATAAGILFAVAHRWRGKLGDAVLAHATANTLLTAYVFLTGEWRFWS